MSKQLWPIEIECDAPPYPVVRASRQAGLITPEDVRWLRLSRFVLAGSPGSDKAAGDAGAADRAGGLRCSCGDPLPKVCTVAFAFATGLTLSLVLGQCCRCQTVFWDPT
jgi:hypothetical protein